ncbi:MAG: hypothetical protein C0417_13070 [Chlorobiaceae bacterium]|nr:hypothetical protein [Chlorobiaceae bacterium]
MVTITPTTKTERIDYIDILRGLSIFGILLMNIVIFSLPTKMFDVSTHPWPSTMDVLANWFTVFFVKDKFYHLFALLFGVSFSIMMERTKSRNTDFSSFYSRRLIVLFIIGLIHGFLIWSGDVLVIYSILGFILLLIRNHTPNRLLLYAIISISIPIIIPVVKKVFEMTTLNSSPEDGSTNYYTQAMRQLFVYGKGSFSQITDYRAAEVLHFYISGLDSFTVRAFSMMVLGLFLWRKGVIQNIKQHLPLLKNFMWFFLAIGFAGQFLRVTADEFSFPHDDTYPLIKLATLCLNVYSVPLLAFGYAIAILQLIQNVKLYKIFAPIGYVGRMAITNYLFHSIFFTTIFYGYGFGLYGEIEPACGILLSTGMFIFQIGFSNWWLNKFRFGPIEWIWRSLTYGSIQRLRIEPESSKKHC